MPKTDASGKNRKISIGDAKAILAGESGKFREKILQRREFAGNMVQCEAVVQLNGVMDEFRSDESGRIKKGCK